MKDKKTREDIKDIKEASKSRDFFDILRKRQRRNVMTEAYRETEQAENSFFKERAQKHNTEALLDKPSLKKAFTSGIFLIILLALVVLAVVLYIHQSSAIKISSICISQSNDSSFLPGKKFYCNVTIIPKTNLTNIHFCLYYSDAFNYPDAIKCNFNYTTYFAERNPNPSCFVKDNLTANQKYICRIKIRQKPNQTSLSGNFFEVCYNDHWRHCVRQKMNYV